MKLSDFDYRLPESHIAQFPPQKRGHSRLLCLNRHSGELSDFRYFHLPRLLKPNDTLILNDTRVIKARIITDPPHSRQFLLLEAHSSKYGIHQTQAIFYGSLKVGETFEVSGHSIRVKSIDQGIATLSSQLPFLKLSSRYGQVPLPPYLHRPAVISDTRRYQTVFAHHQGSVAAPTASLNLTNSLLNQIRSKGVSIHFLTLHVGLGTFKPIRTENLTDHQMHSEWYHIPPKTLEAIRLAKLRHTRVVALGTTVTRALEHAAPEILNSNSVNISSQANQFIYPGYQFKIIDALLTNFHAPRSTVLMLTAAFASWPYLQKAYRHALNNHYQFLSYGDSLFIS